MDNTLLKSQVVAVSLTETSVRLLDQTCLPNVVDYVTIRTVPDMDDAIRNMIVRGAPAIGIAGAFGLVLGARLHAEASEGDVGAFVKALQRDAAILEASRPTAVNLAWAINRMMTALAEWQTLAGQTPASLLARLAAEARDIQTEDLAMCHAIGRHGAALVPQGGRILTHCNAGALATAGYGTALGVIRSAFAQDSTIHVYADETRPRLQGARLTAWELSEDGIPVTLITDSMAPWLMKQGRIDFVVVGADRIAANGDTANKIGTYGVALAAKAHNIPFYVAAPSSTIDLASPSGDGFIIEERPTHEVTEIDGVRICPEGIGIANPAFDVTPADLITGIITEQGVHRPPFSGLLPNALQPSGLLS